ncbi:MAG: 50S ribosomal protein L29 [Patescibacteria group bacterium]
MELAKIRKLSITELTAEIAKTRNNIVQLRAEVAMHRIKNWRSLAAAKQYLSRLLTIQKEQAIIKLLSNE